MAAVRFRIKGTNVYLEPLTKQQRASATTTTYEAASQAKRFANWSILSGGPNSVLEGALSTVRARSRDARRKFGLADAAINSLVSDIIGTGIRPLFRTPDKDFNAQLAEDWAAWVDESDADNSFDFYGLQSLAVGAMCEGGDSFGRLRSRRLSDGLTVPLQIQVMESEMCPEDLTELFGGNRIRQGIEFNPIGARVAYWFYPMHPYDDEFQFGFNQARRVNASEVFHLAQRRRPGMVRGEPWLTRALVTLRDYEIYDDAQRVRQQIAALFAGFVHQDIEEGDENALFGETDTDEDGVGLAPLEPGTMQRLGPGEAIDFSEPPSPGDSYEPYMAVQERKIASAAGLLYEQLTGDYSKVNDRTWRAAITQFRRRCHQWQRQIVVFQMCRPVMRRWAEFYMLAGKPVPAGITVDQIARPAWIPQGWEYINPQQDVAAKRMEVRSGFRSRSDVVSERGGDIEVVDREIAGDNERADDFELIFDSDPRYTSQSGGNANQSPDNEDQSQDQLPADLIDDEAGEY